MSTTNHNDYQADLNMKSIAKEFFPLGKNGITMTKALLTCLINGSVIKFLKIINKN